MFVLFRNEWKLASNRRCKKQILCRLDTRFSSVYQTERYASNSNSLARNGTRAGMAYRKRGTPTRECVRI